MRKIGRASTSEDCRRLLQHSTTTPTASNSKINAGTRTCDSPPIHGIDAAKLLAATNSEDALKILNQATTTTFSMSTEATKLMSTLQMSAIPSASTETTFNHPHYPYGHGAHTDDTKGSLGRFCTR